ncbi:tetratricopeptide repeat protein [Myxacorys almedinensis]|uniref:Tetratricopeptide repeat protein n=1 Tax=Myxacorys almedinensis A TaxID=2690445 RepID=A0A8J7Z965_9CYAN|nr:tetratricopeptide repeat protein [Myxacorys almedinensis]NDJ17745.1 tetratricopeptide repeat protein [Myxacorys almedinensis A]
MLVLLSFEVIFTHSVARASQPILVQEQAQSSHVFFERGLQKLRARFYKSAIEEFNRALSIDPKFKEAHSGKGFAYIQLGDLHNAIASYKQILQVDPNAASAYSGLALVRQRLGDFQQSLSDSQKSTSLQVLQTARHIYQGELNLLELNQVRGAQGAQETVWQLIERGYQKIAAKDYTGAVDIFTQATRVAPQSEGRPYLDRGVAYFWLRDYRAAIQDFSTSIQRNSQSVKSYEYRARAYEEIGDRQAARSDLQKAVELARQFGSQSYAQLLSGKLQQIR